MAPKQANVHQSPPMLRVTYQDELIKVYEAVSWEELEALGWHMYSYAVNPRTGRFADGPDVLGLSQDDPPALPIEYPSNEELTDEQA